MRGCVVRRGPKSWALALYLGCDPQTGRERRKWYSFKTQREAERARARIVNHLNDGGALPPSTKLRVRDYLDGWLRGHAPQVAPTTHASYRDTIRVHLAPALGDVPLTKLSPQAIRDYITTKLAAGLSPKTVAYHRTVLRKALQQAVEDGLLARNAAALVKSPPKRRRQMQVLDEEQVRVFLAEARRHSPHYRLYLAAITTGMRQGELLGLRWRDVDFTLGVASIQQTFYRLGGSKQAGVRSQMLFKAPKSEKSRRPIPLPGVVVEELRALREEQAERRRLLGEEYEDRDLVFCQDNGKPLHGHNIARRDLRRVLNLDGLREDLRRQGVAEGALPKPLPRIRFHDLRHCCATMLLQQGVHPKVVQELLGHATIGMTLDTYSHVLPGIKEQAVRALEARLFGGGQTPERSGRGSR